MRVGVQSPEPGKRGRGISWRKTGVNFTSQVISKSYTPYPLDPGADEAETMDADEADELDAIQFNPMPEIAARVRPKDQPNSECASGWPASSSNN